MKILILIFILGGFRAHAQTGFFLAIDSKGPCAKQIVSLNGSKKFCITAEAIIKDSEFKVEGQIRDDLTHKNQYFYIRFTKTGFETLTLVCKGLSEKELLFVVDGKVVGIYESKNLKPMQHMPISGPNNSREFKWVYETLTKSH